MQRFSIANITTSFGTFKATGFFQPDTPFSKKKSIEREEWVNPKSITLNKLEKWSDDGWETIERIDSLPDRVIQGFNHLLKHYVHQPSNAMNCRDKKADNVIVRNFRVDDVEAIWNIRTRCIDRVCRKSYSASIIQAWLSSSMPESFSEYLLNHSATIAELDGQVVGYAILDSRASIVDAVFVDPDYQHLGLGYLLLTQLEDQARDESKERLTLYASLNAVKFYERAGYQFVRNDDFLHPDGFLIPCQVMQKSLD